MLAYMLDTESKTAYGETPLIIAVRHGKLLSVKYPLEREPILWLKITTVRILYIMPHQDADFLDLLQSHMANSESTAFFMFV